MIPETERVEVEGFRELFSLGGELLELEGAICTVAREAPESRIFNRAIGLGLWSPLTEEQLDAAMDFFGPDVTWFVSLAPAAGEDARRLLESRGFVTDYAWAKFTRPVGEPRVARSELRIEPAGAEGGRDFARIVRQAYDMAPFVEDWLAALAAGSRWRCYLALDGDEPAAAAALLVDGSTGYLGLAGTLPEHRRKGAQGALLRRRLEDAAAAGCELLVTETGENVGDRPSNSYRNIERAGFELAYVRPNYRAPAAAR